ncbi:aminoglycoside phosphotransferase [Actinorhabdospora filicis]|uniref:Aminoglycoside phosphotransferase n=1 Tax=Actinorhabdospora filicis TaxID=1785913 RepID=A0A9W6SM64_9ACTN|nr:phosphotransferase [Actinorhabdospora filicis]GLZ78339.1 aminoglycoside phosphotransferase [Actinorhabdospora filicis]
MEPAELRRAVEAARATASEWGLRVEDVVVVHDSDRVALRLVGCEVLARVAPVADLSGSEFEVEVARRLTDVGAPVGELDPRVEPRVFVRDGFAISLWTYFEPLASQVAPKGYAEVFLRHHAALRKVELDAPHFTDRVAIALAEVTDLVRSPELPGPERYFLSGVLRELSAAIVAGATGEQLLHGEPHSGNLLNTRRGPLFVDLATCCRGPVEFDLAHAPEEVAGHYAGGDGGLVDLCRALNWALFSAWRWRVGDQMPDRGRQRVVGLGNLRAALGRCGVG